MKTAIKQGENFTKRDHNAAFFEQDIWYANELGIKPSATHSLYRLNFTKLEPVWLKNAAKSFVRLQSATKSMDSCRSYLTALKHFGNFINEYDTSFLPQDIDRELIIGYIGYLNGTGLSATTRGITLLHLRLFLEISCIEHWLLISQPNIIFDADIPKPNPSAPRFIPDNVLKQLVESLHTVPEYMQRLIRVLIETGRRISEVCTLPYDCLHVDESNDHYLTVHDRKTHKKYLIPLSKECVEIIKQQQSYLKKIDKHNGDYLFLGGKNSKVPHAKARMINTILSDLAKQNNILDENGKLWRFSSHQFRHTAGTRMINAGVPQHIVQRYLGHESPEMTSRYAYIHDQTLKNEFQKMQGKLVDIQGKSIALEQVVNEDAKWLKHNVSSQALPNGVCTLPCAQKRCPHANACLTCSNFKTSKDHLQSHKNQLQQTEKIICTAKTNGWQRQVEMNTEVKANLKRIINALEGE